MKKYCAKKCITSEFYRLLFVLSVFLCFVFSPSLSHAISENSRLVRVWAAGESLPLERRFANSLAVEAQMFYGDLYDSLIETSNEDNLLPSLASSWSVSDDRRTYTINLRKTSWSNGDPVTAEQYVDGVKLSLDNPGMKIFLEYFHKIKNAKKYSEGVIDQFDQVGIKAISSNVFTIELVEPSSYFLSVLTTRAFVPAHPKNRTIEGFGQDSSDMSEVGKFISPGPYFVKRVEEKGYLLVKNPHYWNHDQVGYDEIYYLNVDLSNIIDLFENGELDVVYVYSPSQFDEFRLRHPDLAILTVRSAVYYSDFNLMSEKLKNPAVRRALNLAFDREELLRREFPSGEVAARRFVPPDFHGYPDVEASWASLPLAERLALARQLLHSANYDAKHPLELKILSNKMEYHERAIRELARQWKDNLGVILTVDFVSWEELNQGRTVEQSEYDMFRSGWSGGVHDPLNFLKLARSDTAAYNEGRTAYKNSAFNALLDRSEQTSDNDERLKLLSQAEKMMLEDDVIVPIFFYVRRTLIQSNVGGWELASIRRYILSKDLYPLN